MDEITIHVFVDSEGNYQYSIYDCAPEDAADSSPRDGGVIDMNMSSALGIALEHTRSYLRHNRM